MTAQVLLMKRLKGAPIILAAARHILRQRMTPTPNIDVARSHDNLVMHGPAMAKDVAALARRLLDEAGIKSLRKDAVRAIEIIVALPDESGIDDRAFFSDALEWSKTCFRGAPVLSAALHRDEGNHLHLHVLVLPLVAGRMIGSDLVAGFAKQDALQADFHRRVGSRHGLTHQPRQTRASAANKRETADSIVALLKARHGLVIGPEAEKELARLVAVNPAGLLRALVAGGPKLKRHKVGGFVDLMTAPMKPVQKRAQGLMPRARPRTTTPPPPAAREAERRTVTMCHGSTPPGASPTVAAVPPAVPTVRKAAPHFFVRFRATVAVSSPTVRTVRPLRCNAHETLPYAFQVVAGPLQRGGP